ncbi:MAG: MerR family transcriptional regulator [Burkholderiales bacterium]|nr:MerR family transcriptional regulator [Burkholderiales bacterium]
MLSISQVERDTGLSKDTLRMWERRYGFPQPGRDAFGERLYDAPQVDKLRVIKRLMDAGQRPGKLMDKSYEELSALGAQQMVARADGAPPAAHTDLIALLQAHDSPALEQHLTHLLLRQGLQQFVLATLAPLNVAVGEAWARGDLAIFEEHLYTERVQGVLRSAIQSMSRRQDAPRVLLTTLPQEQHALGLLMVETLLASERVPCIALGTQTPLQDIATAAAAHRADIVALSFSDAFPLRAAAAGIASLHPDLAPSTTLWVGGSLVARLKQLPRGVCRIQSLADVLPALEAWRAASNRSVPG